jgi:hypothetical protein
LGFGGLAVVHQDIGLTQLRRQVVVARADLGVFDQGALRVVALFGDAAEVQVRRVDVAFPGDQVFQVALGLVPGLGFQADQRQGVTQFVVFRVLLDQAGELALWRRPCGPARPACARRSGAGACRPGIS